MPGACASVQTLVRYIWLGAVIMRIGGVIAATDRRYRVRVEKRSTDPVAAPPGPEPSSGRLMWKFLIPVAVFIALAVLFALGLNPKRDIHALPSPLIGKPAPAFDLTDVMDPSRHVDNTALKARFTCSRVGNLVASSVGRSTRKFARHCPAACVPLIGLDYMDQREKAQQWLTQLGKSVSGGRFRYRRPDRDQLGRVWRAPRPIWSTAAGKSSTNSSRPSRQKVWEHEFLPRISAGAAEWFVIRRPLLLAAFLLATAAGAALRVASDRRATVGCLRRNRESRAQPRYEHITQNLRCLVCQKRIDRRLHVELASDLRRQVREMLIGRQERRRYLSIHDGPLWRVRPLQSTADAEDLADLGAPFIMVAVGAVVIIRVARHRARLPVDDEPASEIK